MRPSGICRFQTIARTGLLATVLLGIPPRDATAQDPPAPPKAEKPSGTGVAVPSTDELLKRSENASVKADAIWVTITQLGKNTSRWVVDLNREGSCYVLKDEDGLRTIYGGAGVPEELVKRAFVSLTRRSVIYGERGRAANSSSDRRLMSIGMATWDGSRVYKTQSGPVESYPQEVQEVIASLREIAEQLPVSEESMGSIRSTFLRPAEARRLLVGGKRIVTVEDPGKDAEELSTLEMAVRLPGRDIVVPTVDDWEALKTYVVASNPQAPESGEFYVQVSARVFQIKMEEAAGNGSGPVDAEEGDIPRAVPTGR
jgi:hypothetical protein